MVYELSLVHRSVYACMKMIDVNFNKFWSVNGIRQNIKCCLATRQN